MPEETLKLINNSTRRFECKHWAKSDTILNAISCLKKDQSVKEINLFLGNLRTELNIIVRFKYLLQSRKAYSQHAQRIIWEIQLATENGLRHSAGSYTGSAILLVKHSGIHWQRLQGRSPRRTAWPHWMAQQGEAWRNRLCVSPSLHDAAGTI